MGGVGGIVALDLYMSCCSHTELVVGDEFEAASAAPCHAARHWMVHLSLCTQALRFSSGVT